MLTREIESSDAAAKEGMRAIARRVMSLAKIYDHLLGNGLSHTIDFDQYLRSLCEGLRDFQATSEFHIALTCEGEPKSMTLDLDMVTALGIVVAEIISNAYLHAFPGRAGKIRVILARAAAGAILTIGDDGVGFRLMQQIGGTVSVVSDRGTQWTLAFPTTA
jgi:two-component sensor histidine kinase